jgi:hypothetical protein
MRLTAAVLVPVLWVVGCSSTAKVVQAPPIPDDIAWSRPQAVEEPMAPPKPVERPPAPHERVFAYTYCISRRNLRGGKHLRVR